jgi:hypothetical protein
MKAKSWLVTRLASAVFLLAAPLQSEAYAGSPMPPPQLPFSLPLFPALSGPFKQPSDLIGATVEDQDHERFAKIKEVRIDQGNPSGSTAVIETMKGGIYEPGEMYLVPLASFTASTHGKMVMLKVPLNRVGGRPWR